MGERINFIVKAKGVLEVAGIEVRSVMEVLQEEKGKEKEMVPNRG